MVEEVAVQIIVEKLKQAKNALITLEEALNADFSRFVQDAAIRRFEYTVEAVWKLLQVYLKESEGLICASPKSALRDAKKVGLLNDSETERALEMIDDRNLTSHTYHAEIAQALFKRLASYSELMKHVLERIEKS
ncbi:MAG: HI0074 family nucleotidyltransferase substrate-binding subunit [bacterium]